MSIDHIGNKARRDLVTNPAWFVMMDALQETLRKEQANLHSVAGGAELARINTQAGITQGVERAILRLENFQKEILDDASPHPAA